MAMAHLLAKTPRCMVLARPLHALGALTSLPATGALSRHALRSHVALFSIPSAPYSSQREKKSASDGGHAWTTMTTTTKKKIVPRRGKSSKMDLRFQRESELKGHKQRFQSQMSKTQRWMEHRAAAGDFAAIVQGIADCYEPLFRKHPALVGMTCSLHALLDGDDDDTNNGSTDFDAERDENGDDDDDQEVAEATRGPRPRYQDGRAKMMEQLALELLFKGSRSDLAVAVYENRRAVSKAIAESGLELNDREQRMSEHYRSFFSMAAGAYAALNKHEQVVDVYETAIAAQLWPTVTMNVNYVRALTTLRRFDDVDTAYRVISATDGFQNIFFYRCMLFYTSISGNTSVLLDVLAKMKEQRYALRGVDYQHCIRAFDGSLNGEAKRGERASAMPASYLDFQALHERSNGEVAPLDEDEESSAHAVLFLFDQLCQSGVETPEELGKNLYPRVLAAAIKLRDYDRVVSIVKTRSQYGESAPFGDEGLQFAVTGLLLGDRPEAAWRLVTQEYEHACPHPRAHAIVVANLLDYLCLKKQVFLIVDILDDLKRRNAANHGVVSNAHVRKIIDTLCAVDRETMDDARLYTVISDSAAIFRVHDKPFWFTYFLTSCHDHQRYDAVKEVFRARKVEEIPTIPIALALSLMQDFCAEKQDFEFAYHIFQAVNLQSDKCTMADKCSACYAAMRACAQVEWLGQDEVRAIYESHLKTLISESQLPEDIKSLVAAD